MIKEGKGNKALIETVTRINNGETITEADINSIADNREYISEKYGIEISGSTDAEVKQSATEFLSALENRVKARNDAELER